MNGRAGGIDEQRRDAAFYAATLNGKRVYRSKSSARRPTRAGLRSRGEMELSYCELGPGLRRGDKLNWAPACAGATYVKRGTTSRFKIRWNRSRSTHASAWDGLVA